ncbi:hypothetical protein [Staphylococcus sp. HMSC056D08]|uniref:hypothetical protein n=2 Tax=unclassified Staphylococcus TaxID=91994 RepID=UPI0008AA2592|nr:hypothetical protein [Staphylococcus sp. HMSC056D08]OHR51729.1 hypothetical protein HMPREF2951_08510 [Staphylococcus sp. HMSC056D08]
MKYKYMEKQVEGAKALAEKYPHMQTHQDIYKEHVEVLEKAKMFDEIKELINWFDEIEPYEFKAQVVRIKRIINNLEDKK